MCGYIQTYTGKRIFYNAITEDDIRIEDIAHALSSLCRYNGHTQNFYSVAQHSLWVAENCSKEAKLYALLHDATEAYIGDMVSPLKKMFPEFEAFENNLNALIMRALGVEFNKDIVDEVMSMDKRILVAEFNRYLSPVPPTDHLPNYTKTKDGRNLRFSFYPEKPLELKEVFIKSYEHFKKGVGTIF